jgi:hypothetical protein
MNGLIPSEIKALAEIRAASNVFAASHDRADFDAMKRLATKWVKANAARAARRRSALRTVRFAYAHLPG